MFSFWLPENGKPEDYRAEVMERLGQFLDVAKDSGLIEACLVAVPHYEHAKYAMECMKRGIHVMVEKPAGVFTKQVREMNEEAEKHPEVVFGMMFNQRTNHIYRKMRELVQSGEYGRIRRTNWIITDWYRPQAYYDSGDWRATWRGEGGGVLLNQCPHQLDFRNPESHLYKDSSISEHISYIGNVYTYGFQLYKDEEDKSAIEKMIESRGITGVSFFGAFSLLCGLIRHQRFDWLKEFLLDEGAWIRMLREDATTTFEGWGKDAKTNASLFHLTFSYAVIFLADIDQGYLFEK
ncbi:MAG: Gfo/Idh/MocA family oxidoreductase [Tyzzerella sp.]|nr:Gfo/Idh/MocA family oxidoreductase [Tyzzerella sp.]MBQ4559798.1 Gfo/Idh/MocA family oxidoreductase [Tyzzerella sp.]